MTKRKTFYRNGRKMGMKRLPDAYFHPHDFSQLVAADDPDLGLEGHPKLILDRRLNMLDDRHIIRRGPVVDVDDEARMLGRNLGPTMRVTLQTRVMNQFTGIVALWPFEDTPAGWQLQGLLGGPPLVQVIHLGLNLVIVTRFQGKGGV